MCGFVGYYSPQKFSEELITRMGNAIAYRGPDAEGYLRDEENGLHACHRRLSIIDLSAAGAQPMSSYTRRYSILFNGEIYNYLDIQKELNQNGYGYPWNGHSDTEVILRAFEVWGIAVTLKKMTGMFALALWDRSEKRLYLCRDRLGEKPLYYGWQGNSFFFGSELKAFLPHPEFCKKIDPRAVSSFFKYNYVPGDQCIYSGINKLKPGYFAEIGFDKKDIALHQYWDLKKVVSNAKALPNMNSPEDWKYALELHLKDAVKNQMLADVPLGAFLSGGIDSSLIVSLMQAQSTQKIKTFTIGFGDKNFDEARYAKAVALHLGTDHNELYVSSNDALSVVPQLAKIYDEPFADSSQIPTYLLSKLARTEVTVSLSGDGGDELFSGYTRYKQANDTWNTLQYLPANMRKGVGEFILSKTADRWDAGFNSIKSLIPTKYHRSYFGDTIHKGANLLRSPDQFSLYDGFLTHWKSGSIMSGEQQAELYNFEGLEALDFREKMMALDTDSYLPNDILVKVDRASMSNSLETRVPLLDHRIVEFAWKVPMNFKVRDGKTKWLLREVLYKYVPKNLIERPKMGFGIPLESWLKGPLKEWASDLLSAKSLEKHGLLNNKVIQSAWQAHLKGEHKWHYKLWDVLMFQLWHSEYFGH